MSYETGTATSLGDLMVKWFNFLQANGWTADVDYAVDLQSPEYGVIHRKIRTSPENTVDDLNLICAFKRDDSTDMWMIPMRDYTAGEPFTGGIEIGTQLNQQSVQLRVNPLTTPYESYHFFESDFYAHAVVEYATGFFRHFGMGQLNKIGKWWGGEYYYGHFWDTTQATVENAQQHTVMFDNLSVNRGNLVWGRQLSGDNFPDFDAGSPNGGWHTSNNTQSASNGGTDFDGNLRGQMQWQGSRDGPHWPLYHRGRIAHNGFRPMFPVYAWSVYGGVNPDNCRCIGSAPDVRMMPMDDGLAPKTEFTIGADTWMVFPLTRKATSGAAERSDEWGISYKKVLT